MAKKILIIEDDRFLRKIIVKKLTLEGFQTLEALDGEEGMKKTKEEKPALVLLDLVLPRINGFKVLSHIKKDQETSNIPIIILSNLGQREEIEKGLRLGAHDYMIKAHFTPDEIIEKINKILK
ncbi:MAG: response regulator [Minisyncoccales bacterium]